MAKTSPNTTSPDVDIEQHLQHSIRLSEPPPMPAMPPKRAGHHSIRINQPPEPPPLPAKRSVARKPLPLEDDRENYIKICIPLYNAALKGDWHAAEGIIRDNPEAIYRSITKREDTLLHIVASTKHTRFAQKLVNMMKVEDLELQNGDGATALCIAVANSTIKMVDILLKRNNGLLKIRINGDLPFMCAVLSGDKHMVKHIYSKTNVTDEKWNYSDKKRVLDSCVAFRLLDIAVEILIATRKKGFLAIDIDVLRYLACNPSAFEGTRRPAIIRKLANALFPRAGPTDNYNSVKLVRTIWGEIVKEEHEDILKLQMGGEGLLFSAARLGNYKFIIELLRLYPEITWDRDDNKHTIFHVAVMHRHQNVYNLLYELGSKKLGIRDNNGNNILHLAAVKPTQNRLNIVSGAALQMQRELLWFKEVESMVNSIDRIKRNNDGKTPHELFTDEHAMLMEKGEVWMKQTAAQCMVVAALIATIMFAAAFTLPGGNNQDSGHPIFLNRSAFIVFVVTDAISLCTSSSSILMFLAILTARYIEKDFLVSLPVKLMVGLLTLFISIATMMIAFGASFFLLYSKTMKWIPISVTILAGLPVILFARLQYRLLFDVINSTFNSGHLFRPKKRMLY